MSDRTAAAPPSSHSFPCAGCGASVEFAPGTDVLRCPYCGHEQKLAESQAQVRERSFDELAALPRKPVAGLAAYAFVCQKCGAHTESDTLSQRCQFCGSPLVAEVDPAESIVPEAVLPLHLDRAAARTALRTWAASRWFAPGGLKTVTDAETTKATYLPHWTYDARTESDYSGQRGEHYWVTETYTETVDGQSQTRTRQVQQTRWHSADGTVRRDFDDVLVTGTGQLTEEQLTALTPWPLEQVVAYRPEYLAGHHALRYDVEPEAGLETAKTRMATIIEQDCRGDIGGDEQRVDSVDTRYAAVTFKLLLLPVWIVAYLHAGKTYQVLINGCTGKVTGQRPYSVAKIVAAVLAVLLAIALAVVLVMALRAG
jgi:DNA-directed RNA polymerase subunit RPC12/RpoP